MSYCRLLYNAAVLVATAVKETVYCISARAGLIAGKGTYSSRHMPPQILYFFTLYDNVASYVVMAYRTLKVY